MENGRAKAHVAAKTQDSRELVRVGIGPAGGNLQHCCRFIHGQKGGKTSQPFLNEAPVETVVHPETLQSWDFLGVAANPVSGYLKDGGQLFVGEEREDDCGWCLVGCAFERNQVFSPYE